MRMQPLLAEMGNGLGSTIQAPAKNVADPEPRQWFLPKAETGTRLNTTK